MLYQNVEATYVDPSWWPALAKRAELFHMANELAVQADAFAARDVPVYHVDAWSGAPTPGGDADDPLDPAFDFAPTVRAIVMKVRQDHPEGARIVFRVAPGGGYKYGMTSYVPLLRGNAHLACVWFPPDDSDGVEPGVPGAHGIEIVVEAGVEVHVGNGTSANPDTDHLFAIGSPPYPPDQRVKLLETFGYDGAGSLYTTEDYWLAADQPTAAATLAPHQYDLAEQWTPTPSDGTVIVPAGARSVTLAAAGHPFQPGDVVAITWDQTLDGGADPEPSTFNALTHLARVTRVSGATIDFWPPTEHDAAVRSMPAGYQTLAGFQNAPYMPVTLCRIEERAVHGWGLRGPGKIVAHHRGAIWALGGGLVDGQFIRDLDIENVETSKTAAGNGIENVLIENLRLKSTARATGATVPTADTQFSNAMVIAGLDKGCRRAVVRDIRLLDATALEQWVFVHIHEGVRDCLVTNIDLVMDDSTADHQTYLTARQQAIVDALQGNHDVWVEGLKLRYSTGAVAGSGSVVKIDDSHTGICGMVNIDLAGTTHTCLFGLGATNPDDGTAFYYNVTSDAAVGGNSINGNLTGGGNNIFVESAANVGRQVALWQSA